MLQIFFGFLAGTSTASFSFESSLCEDAGCNYYAFSLGSSTARGTAFVM